MFKLESYITPILLSYVDRYIKNFRLEDSQVSLWGGDASFHNLDLRLDVLEQELQLPFSFVSGHIRELLIHVPWTKLNSQPITITINTIECILKLRGADATASSDTSNQSRDKTRKPVGKQEVEAPPGYVQLLINKIVSNIRIYCNNLILKYVEEDIVLSMNVKHLKFESANEKWEPAYTELSPAQVILRKVITVNDLTLCLDKRNAAGKIDVYQEPMLYRCSMTMHLLRHYHSATANRASTTRLDIYCNKMEFGMTEQQVPMLMRLMMLLYALQQKQLKPDNEPLIDSSNIPTEFRDNAENTETWTGWAWSYVSSVLPTQWDEEWNTEQLKNYSGHTVHIGFYVDNASITFKVSESSGDRGYYSHKKLKYWPMLQLQLQGIYCENIIHGIKWFNSSCGIGQALLVPQGFCSCSQPEITDGTIPYPYLKLGSVTTAHKADSLFDVEAIENKGEKRTYNTSWDYHMMTNSESVLLERTPAFAMDYVYQMEIPEDMTSDRLSELGSDFEFSNLSEMSSLRICFGPFKLKLCSGLFHRISSLQVAASYYDYSPYSTPKPDLAMNELLPPSEEDFDALNEFISSRSMRITFFAPIIELQLMDHPYFVPTRGTLFRRKKHSSSTPTSLLLPDLPKITIECQFLDISMQTPMYVNRLVHTTCQLPDPPKELFDACYAKQSIKVLGLCCKLIISPHRQTTILTPGSASYTCKTILKPQYWINSNIPHEERTFESESITLNGTKAKVMVIYHIIEKMLKREPIGVINSISNTTLLNDAAKDYGLPYIELCIEGVRFKKVTTNTTVSIDMCAGSIKAFIFEPIDVKAKIKDFNAKKDFVTKDIQQVLFISGPEPKRQSPLISKIKSITEDLPLFTATMQYPLNPDTQTHAPILIFNLQEIRICVDPLLCRWLLYSPKTVHRVDYFDPTQHKKKNISEASGSMIETPRRLSSQLESVHSSSDREQLYIPQKVPKSLKENGVDIQEKVYNILKKWFDVWKGMFLCGDISQCTIYFPMVSLSAVGAQGIQEAVEQAINKDYPPEIMVIALPFANIRSAQRQNITKYLTSLPINLSQCIWASDKSSFPWTMSVSDLSCYSIQYGNKLIFLKPVSLSATVGLSTRSSKTEASEVDPESAIATTLKTDIGYLGVCVHVDMTPVIISTSEVQVYLFASILYGLMEVVGSLMPEKPKIPKTPDLVPPLVNKGSSTLSPTIIRENTNESVSEQTPPLSTVTENTTSDNVKLTAWIQWTITRFSIELLSNEYKFSKTEEMESLQPHLKLVIDAEDIVSSLDFQSVYLKIKNKIGAVSIQHYKRKTPTSKWKPGPFSGIVMRLQEDITTGQRHEDNGFISMTITRASCKHTHTLWGAVQKKQKDKKSDSVVTQFLSPSRYITEIVVNVQPIDFVFSMKTLRSFYLVLAPLLQIPPPRNKPEKESSILQYMNNQTLPLAYLDCQDIRVIMPSVELGSSGAIQDVCIFQVHKICLSPSAVNPICRVPCRPDIYEQAAHARILNIPGSEVEDRQYQLDIIGMCISTGTWDDIDSVLSPSGSIVSNLRTLSENPAVEWNNMEQGQPNMTPILNLWPVTDKFDISVIAAPAMIYNDSTIICGNFVEVNFVSDIFIHLSLHQIKLTSALLTEFLLLLEPFILEEEISKRPKIKLPYSSVETTCYEFEEDDEGTENLRDSGIDTSDIRSLKSSKAVADRSTVLTNTESEKQYVFPRPPNPLPPTYNMVPIEILFTAGKMALSLYKVDVFESSGSKFGGKRKKKSIIDPDQGYEASEENAEEQAENHKRYVPLLYFALNQPNAFLSKQQLGRRIQVSCFDINMKLSGPEYMPVGHLPTEQDYPIHLIETRTGTPDSNTGILPAFFTLRFSRGLAKNAHLEIDISRPIKLLCSTSKWRYLIMVRDSVIESFQTEKTSSCLSVISNIQYKSTTSNESDLSSNYSRSLKYSDTYSKFQNIKELLCGINTINVNFDQILFAMKSRTGHEVNLSFGKLKSQMILFSRPEKLTNTCTLECITLTVIKENFKKLLLNPWSLSLEVCLFWESWQSTDSEPQVQFSAESECIIFDISPEQIQCVEMVIKDLKELIELLPPKQQQDKMYLNMDRAVDREQYYKDDLRAGAFQFVDANVNSADELPLPYQVMFWNKNISAMAWRYPQPRALTKVRVFPVPYKMSLGIQDDLQVLCHLEYWSDIRNCYLPYTHFYLSESEVSHLTLPKGSPQTVVACTWRVVINMINIKEEQSNIPNVSISPRALAACMRIDSYFNKALIPNFTAAVYITKIDINLYSYTNKNSVVKLPEALKNYHSDMLIPENQKFVSLTWDNLTSYITSWNFEMLSVEVSSSTKCNVLDYTFLTELPLLEPFTYKLELFISDNLTCNFVSKPVHFKFGPNIAHTLAVSGQLWLQSFKPPEEEVDFIIVTKYVVCNDTNVNIRFGQTSTDEDILLFPRHFHLYSWRSQKKKQELKVAIEENEWIWCKSFQINQDGIQMIKLNTEKNITLLITVKSLSSTQKQIIISGQLIVCNMLLENFELKLTNTASSKDSVEFKSAPTYIVAGRTSTPSIFVNSKKQYYLRLRFFGLDSAWTGDIPLREHTTGSQPWLVKVPLQERGQFMSIWCRIVIQDSNNVQRYMAMLWPLFTIRSNLPINAKVKIETPTLNAQLDSIVNGRGELQQLYCPGTIDHSHQLTFLLDNGITTSNPYVPLNYSLVDQQKFFKKMEKEDIDNILSSLQQFGETKWPYFGDELDEVDWIVEDQPLTHVQVRYQNACPFSSSLMVELLPWCLMVNTVGVPIFLMGNGSELCKLQHHGIVSPPKLEENFSIVLDIDGQGYSSESLQLAKSDWSQTFYMPKITGTVPLEGAIKVPIKCDKNLSMISVMSTTANEIRLLKVSSTHVLSNQSSVDVQVMCFAVPNLDKIYDIPKEAEDFKITLPAYSKNLSNTGYSISQWYNIDKETESNCEYAFYVAFSTKPELGWSCPIRVDKALIRKSFSVTCESHSVPLCITSHENKGQTFLAVNHDTRPQIFLENKTLIPLLCAQILSNNVVAKETQHFKWNCVVAPNNSVHYTMPFVSEKFPEIPQHSFVETIAFAVASDGEVNKLQWSQDVNIAVDNELFIRIPYFGDVKLGIYNAATFAHLVIESVSQVEISARDIRVRLSMQTSSSTELLSDTIKNTATTSSAFHSCDDLSYSLSENEITNESHIVPFQKLPTVTEHAKLKMVPSEVRRKSLQNDSDSMVVRPALLVRALPMNEDWSSLNIRLFVKSFSITLTSELERSGNECCELANLVCDNVALSVVQTEFITMQLVVSDIQFDNQLYSRESYDFPVVFIGQTKTNNKKMTSLNIPIETLFKREENSLLVMSLTFETCKDEVRRCNVTGAKNVQINLKPISCYIEDVYITRLSEYLNIFMPNQLVVWPVDKKCVPCKMGAGFVYVPELVAWQCAILARPLTIRSITVAPVSVLLSVHCSIKLYIALDQSPLQFGKFERKRLFTSPYRLGHAFTMHYLSGAIFGAGWVVSSLELLGSPGGLARAMGSGLRDFVSLPYRGLVQGPMAFLRGITQGSASLMWHVTSGTLQSVTKLASSVARNLDRLTLDEEHLRRTEEQRRQRPQGLAQGFIQGLTGLGISLLGAVGGIAHHPLQSVMADGASPRSLAAGVGLGLVGVFTKPLSGAAELVALTGQGLLQGAGWNPLPEPRIQPVLYHMYSSPNSVVKYSWKLTNSLSNSNILYVTEATSISNSQYDAVALILTLEALIIINTDEDKTQKVISLEELSATQNNDPTLLMLKLTPPVVQVKKEDENVLEMDPVCRARVADYVRSTVGLLNLPDNTSPDHSDISISPLSSPRAMSTTSIPETSTVYSFYVNPQNRNYFLCLLNLAKQQHPNYHFPVL